MKIRIKCLEARRIADPVTNGDRYFFVVNAVDVPQGMPKGPNPREQNIDRSIYRMIARSLLNDEGAPNAFYVKNKGITVLANKVTKVGSGGDHVYDIYFESGDDGVVDGGHTYDIICNRQNEIISRNENGEEPPIEQYVEMRILTGARLAGLVSEIAGGLNTSVQVQPASLANLSHYFDWIKTALSSKSYADKIAYKQNAEGEYTVTDILAFVDLFNVEDFKQAGNAFPTRAYDSPNRLLAAYIKECQAQEKAKEDGKIVPLNRWQKSKDILPDILELHDIMRSTGVQLYNSTGQKRGGALAWVRGNQVRKGKDGQTKVKEMVYPYEFLGTEGPYDIYRGALIPMLGAFRCLVDEDPRTGLYRWKCGFDGVKKLWQELGAILMEKTQNTSEELGRRPDAIGKSQNHWGVMYNTVMSHYLLQEVARMQRAERK